MRPCGAPAFRNQMPIRGRKNVHFENHRAGCSGIRPRERRPLRRRDTMIKVDGNPRLQRALLIPLVILAWLGLAVVVVWLLSHVTRALLIVVVATLIAFALTPLINLLARWIPRGIAIGLSYLVGFILIFGLLGVVVATAASQLSGFVANLPAYQSQAQHLQPALLGLLNPLGVTSAQVGQVESQAVTELKQFGSTAASSALGVVQLVLGAIVDAVLVLILSVYLAASAPRLIQRIREEAPRGQRRRATLLVGTVNQIVGGYIRGTFVLATLVGVLVGGGMALLNVRYALLLGILAFFMEFVPVLGVLVSGAVCVIVALFTGWITALLVVVYFAVVHVIEGDVVGPRIMGKAVGIHPGVAIVALVAGSELFGIWGALFGAPLAGLVQAIGVAVIREIRLVNARDVRQQAQAHQAEAEGETLAAGTTSDASNQRTGSLLTGIEWARRRVRRPEGE
jgi:predicted PurR-regulated permease PerM